MKVTSISKFRKDIKRFVDEVDQDQEPLIVTRSDNVSVVLLPLTTFNSYTETEYLLRNPVNAARLRRSLKKARTGAVQKHALIEE
jgi:antitoxin YefM